MTVEFMPSHLQYVLHLEMMPEGWSYRCKGVDNGGGGGGGGGGTRGAEVPLTPPPRFFTINYVQSRVYQAMAQ